MNPPLIHRRWPGLENNLDTNYGKNIFCKQTGSPNTTQCSYHYITSYKFDSRDIFKILYTSKLPGVKSKYNLTWSCTKIWLFFRFPSDSQMYFPIFHIRNNLWSKRKTLFGNDCSVLGAVLPKIKTSMSIGQEAKICANKLKYSIQTLTKLEWKHFSPA